MDGQDEVFLSASAIAAERRMSEPSARGWIEEHGGLDRGPKSKPRWIIQRKLAASGLPGGTSGADPSYREPPTGPTPPMSGSEGRELLKTVDNYLMAAEVQQRAVHDLIRSAVVRFASGEEHEE